LTVNYQVINNKNHARDLNSRPSSERAYWTPCGRFGLPCSKGRGRADPVDMSVRAAVLFRQTIEK
jgi:hypothetical protein